MSGSPPSSITASFSSSSLGSSEGDAAFAFPQIALMSIEVELLRCLG
jgi:hypothetical protein